MPEKKSPHWFHRYLIALLVVCATIAILAIPVLGRWLGISLILAVVISAWQGGFGPGLFATILLQGFSILLQLLSRTAWTTRTITDQIAFFGLGLVISLLVEGLHAARRRAEASQHWLSAVLTSIGDAVIATDATGKVVFMNPVAETLCGWTSVDATGRPLGEVFRIVNEHTRDPVESPVDRVLAIGSVVGLANHTVLIARDGVERPIDDSGAPIRDADGEIDGVVLVFRDVTERRMHERRLLEDDRRKNEFLAMLAHELRNPLAAVSNAVQLLHRPEAASLLDWCKGVIGRQVNQLTRLVDDLLDVSRITRGKIQLRPQQIDLVTLLRSASSTVRPLIEERNHDFHVAIEPERLAIEADPTRLEQVVVNLLTNAAKYTKSGGRIELNACLGCGQAIIRVSDNGIGIAPELLPRVFDLFTQGDRSIARSEGGLGIGLTMVQKLVELHGGTVSVESPGLGLGSTFTVRLPARAGEVAAPAPPLLNPVEPGKARILLIDDNVDLGRSMSRLLELLGHEVAVVHDGPAGLEAVHSFRPELILLDIGLPGMDGYEVIRRLRRDESTRDARVIAITGNGQDDDRERALAAGFDDYLTKPIDKSTLLDLFQPRPDQPGRPRIRPGSLELTPPT
jgi:PAS domain S-box-containing protein